MSNVMPLVREENVQIAMEIIKQFVSRKSASLAAQITGRVEEEMMTALRVMQSWTWVPEAPRLFRFMVIGARDNSTHRDLPIIQFEGGSYAVSNAVMLNAQILKATEDRWLDEELCWQASKSH